MLKLNQKKVKTPNRIVILGSRGFIGSSVLNYLEFFGIINAYFSKASKNSHLINIFKLFNYSGIN